MMPTERELKEADRRRREKQRSRAEGESWDQQVIDWYALFELVGLSVFAVGAIAVIIGWLVGAL